MAPLGMRSLAATVLGWYPGHVRHRRLFNDGGALGYSSGRETDVAWLEDAAPASPSNGQQGRRRLGSYEHGFQEDPSRPHGVTVAFGQLAQLTQRVAPAATGLRDHDARPQSLGLGEFARLACAGPAPREHT